MAFQIHLQYVDPQAGFHIVELRDETGSKHVVQIAIGAHKCPLCGSVYPKDNLGEIDPKAMVASVNESLNQSQQNVLAYAKKHGVKVR